MAILRAYYERVTTWRPAPVLQGSRSIENAGRLTNRNQSLTRSSRCAWARRPGLADSGRWFICLLLTTRTQVGAGKSYGASVIRNEWKNRMLVCVRGVDMCLVSNAIKCGCIVCDGDINYWIQRNEPAVLKYLIIILYNFINYDDWLIELALYNVITWLQYTDENSATYFNIPMHIST